MTHRNDEMNTLSVMQRFASPLSSALLSASTTPSNVSVSTVARNATLPHKQGWTGAPNARGTIDIIWSCAFTMFLCSWSIVCLNVSSPDDNALHIFHRRVWLTCLCFLGPEFTVLIVSGQWVSAQQSLKDFHKAGFDDWTIQLLFLIRMGFVAAPKLDKKVIRDRNKVDGMLRIITIFQVLYFIANVAGRAAQRLAITCMELTTAAFIVCTIATVFFWIHKPADVNTSEHLNTTSSMAEIVLAAVAEFRPEDKEKLGDNGNGDNSQPAQNMYNRTPLDFISRKEWHWSLYWSNWINILRHLHIDFAPPTLPVNRFENTIAIEPTRGVYWCCLAVTTIYTSVFLCAWNYDFPTKIEQYLWRAASLTIFGTLIAFYGVTEFAFTAYPFLARRYGQKWSLLFGRRDRLETTVNPAAPHSIWTKLRHFAARVRNNSPSNDPSLYVPLKAILPINIIGVLYCSARTYILLSDVFELRSLPSSVFVTVDWANFIPHI
ncbi:hypothetical protein EJ08DRAFT_669985 [Tothia fuscella]|uniref:Uncharacterized protein n=1 Tax=Tothia fuscella TaxID=1048955 RepID=A0A9P4NSI0_9PEZI|nr:hypothetical protein EJ08DRAFT_669985 [Tothia fuscella]